VTIPVCERVLAEARLWLGTPYRHQASVRGAGCDCLGLVRGVWRAIHDREPEPVPPYTADWGETGNHEPLLAAGLRHMTAVAVQETGPGDILVFRWRVGMAAKHLGILSGQNRFIHAWERAGVVEAPLVPAWRARIAAAFRIPEPSGR